MGRAWVYEVSELVFGPFRAAERRDSEGKEEVWRREVAPRVVPTPTNARDSSTDCGHKSFSRVRPPASSFQPAIAHIQTASAQVKVRPVALYHRP